MDRKNRLIELLGEDFLKDDKPTDQRANGADGHEGIGPDTIFVPLPGRTFSRRQGCFNCRHFDVGDKAQNAWEADMLAYAEDQIRTGLENGYPNETVKREVVLRVQSRNRLYAPPKAGLCTSVFGKTQGKYTMATFLAECWTAKQGVREAHQPLDMLVDEMKDRLGDFNASKTEPIDTDDDSLTLTSRPVLGASDGNDGDAEEAE
jgi:hypothetical protein